MVTGLYLASLFNSLFASVSIAKMGSEWLASYNIYSQIVSSYNPGFIPVWFILSYSSIVLAMKRMRSFSKSRAIIIVSGITNYLFFASIIALIMLFSFLSESELFKSDYLKMVTPILMIVIIMLLVVGFINLIFLYIRRDSEKEILHQQANKRLDIIAYIMKLGKLMAVTLIIAVITGAALFVSNVMIQNETLTISILVMSGVSSVLILYYYFKYTVYRLNDAKISVLWLIGIVGGYLIILALKSWMIIHQLHLFYIFNTLFAIFTSLFIAAQYVLFLLPTKRNITIE